MGETLRKIRFGGQDYWLLGETDGPVVVRPEDYEQGIVSYAHLFENGDLMRYKSRIGTRDDIEFTEDRREAHPDFAVALDNLLGAVGGGWPKL